MAIVSLALFSTNNQTNQGGVLFYIRDFKSFDAGDDDSRGPAVDDFEEDLFNLDEDLCPLALTSSNDGNTRKETPDCSLRHQFLLQSAVDQAQRVDCSKIIRENEASDMCLGLICAMEDVLFYGYRTNSHVYIVLGVEDDILPGDHRAQFNRSKQIRSLLKVLHSKYVEYKLNPFSSLHGKIKSKRFDREIESVVKSANVSWMA